MVNYCGFWKVTEIFTTYGHPQEGQNKHKAYLVCQDWIIVINVCCKQNCEKKKKKKFLCNYSNHA